MLGLALLSLMLSLLSLPLGLALLGQALLGLALLGLLGQLRLMNALLRGSKLGGSLLGLLLGSLLLERGAGPIPRHADSVPDWRASWNSLTVSPVAKSMARVSAEVIGPRCKEDEACNWAWSG